MTNLLQTVIPAAVTFLVGYQGAYPHQPAPQEHPGGHGYARRSPGGPPEPSHPHDSRDLRCRPAAQPSPGVQLEVLLARSGNGDSA
jgi:hypothetical protein